MDISRPYSAVTPSIEGDVLTTLDSMSQPMTGRAIARRVKRGSQPAVNAVLDRLVAHGLVLRTEVPPANVYVLNRQHVGAAAVMAMAHMRSELFLRLRQELNSWSIAPIHVSMYGSAARADGDMQSDIDLFLVSKDDLDDRDEIWRAQIERLEDRVFGWTGNHASLLIVEESRARRLGKGKTTNQIQNLRRDAIHLIGAPLNHVFDGR